jgi:hypothetical protein
VSIEHVNWLPLHHWLPPGSPAARSRSRSRKRRRLARETALGASAAAVPGLGRLRRFALPWPGCSAKAVPVGSAVMAWMIDYHTDAAGRSPFRQWRSALSALEATAVDVKIESDIRPDGPAAVGSTDHSEGLVSVPVHFGGVRLRVYYTAEHATSTVWLLHGYDVAADPAQERAARETAETEQARRVRAMWEQQRRAR